MSVLKRALVTMAAAGAASSLMLAAASGAYAQTTTKTPTPFISHFNAVTTGPSTVPANGDVNPYGTAVVPRSEGLLQKGDVLVSNFNNSNNVQGTGTTIVEVSPSGVVTQFAQINAASLPGSCPGGVGLTTAKLPINDAGVLVVVCADAADAAASSKLLAVPAAAIVTMARLSTLMISRSFSPVSD